MKLNKILTVSSLVTLGCAGELVPPPVLSDAPLGRIIIYRNGVAYFERYTTSNEETLSIRVPAERVDDFLKHVHVVSVDQAALQAVGKHVIALATYEGLDAHAESIRLREGPA